MESAAKGYSYDYSRFCSTFNQPRENPKPKPKRPLRVAPAGRSSKEPGQVGPLYPEEEADYTLGYVLLLSNYLRQGGYVFASVSLFVCVS